MNKKKISCPTIFSFLFLIILLCCVAINSAGINAEAGTGDAYAFLLIFALAPLAYYVLIFSICLLSDLKKISAEMKVKYCLVFIPAILIIGVLLFNYVASIIY